MTKEELAKAVCESKDLVEVSGELIALANERGGPDNITVIVARVTGEGLQPPGDDDSVGHEIFPLQDSDEPTEEVPLYRNEPPQAPQRSSMIAVGVTAAALVAAALLIAVL